MTTSPRKLLTFALGAAIAAAAATAAFAQQGPKPEQLIKWRQSAFQVIAWNSGRIKASLDGNYDKENVIRSASVIASLSNAGIGSLFAPGTETGKGWKETSVKPELFKSPQKVGELNANFVREANELARVAATGDGVAVKAQYAKLNGTCKGCHDEFRAKD